jgi:hypothetical protein
MNKLIKMDGYDDCILGIVERCGKKPFYLYDRELVLDQLMADGATEEEAIDFHEFNQAGAWVGEQSPGFLNKMTYEESLERLG